MATPKKITAEQLRKIELAKERERRKEAGYFDGRFAPKSIPDKKKKESKRACRKWKGEDHE